MTREKSIQNHNITLVWSTLEARRTTFKRYESHFLNFIYRKIAYLEVLPEISILYFRAFRRKLQVLFVSWHSTTYHAFVKQWFIVFRITAIIILRAITSYKLSKKKKNRKNRSKSALLRLIRSKFVHQRISRMR